MPPDYYQKATHFSCVRHGRTNGGAEPHRDAITHLKKMQDYVLHLEFLTFSPNLTRWVKEAGGMKKILEIFSGIPAKDIKGFRAPYLQAGGDDMLEALNRSGMSYDSSYVAGESQSRTSMASVLTSYFIFNYLFVLSYSMTIISKDKTALLI